MLSSGTAGSVTGFGTGLSANGARPVSRPGPTAISGSPKPTEPDRANHARRRRHRVQPQRPNSQQRPVRHHGRPRRQPLVHRVQRQPRSAGSRPPASITEFGAANGRPPQPARRDHGRAGRQPLVHRVRAATSIGRITPAGVVTEFSAGITPNSEPVRASRPAPTATSGSPSTGQRRSAGSRPAGASPSSAPASPPAASPIGITAGPDGNLWFTEHGRQPHRPDHARRRRHRVQRRHHRRQPARRDHGRPRRQPLVHRAPGNRIGRITPAGASPSSPGSQPSSRTQSASPPGRTATSGSPRAPATRSAGPRAGGTVITTGSQTYNDAVTVPGNEVLTSTAANGNISFTGTVNSDGARAGRLTVTAAQVQIGGTVGGGNPLAGLSVNDAGPAASPAPSRRRHVVHQGRRRRAHPGRRRHLHRPHHGEQRHTSGDRIDGPHQRRHGGRRRHARRHGHGRRCHHGQRRHPAPPAPPAPACSTAAA